jgi:hypothetical protein
MSWPHRWRVRRPPWRGPVFGADAAQLAAWVRNAVTVASVDALF